MTDTRLRKVPRTKHATANCHNSTQFKCT